MNASKKKRKNSADIQEKNISSQHESTEEVLKEEKINKNLTEFSQFLNNYIEQIKIATKEYCTKLNKILETINVTNNNEEIKNNPEKELENNLYQITKDIIEILSNNFLNIKYEQNEKEDLSILDKKLKELKVLLNLDLEKIDFNKVAYCQEFKSFEKYLIEEELNNDIKDNTNFNNKIDNILELQNLYFDMNNKLKTGLKNIFINIISKRKIIIQNILEKHKRFYNNIQIMIEKFEKRIAEEIDKKYCFQNINYLEILDEKVNNIFKLDIYDFKFLLCYRADNVEKREIIKDKKNYGDLFDLLNKLNENIIENIAEKIEKNTDICLGEKSKKKLNLIKTKKNIDKKIQLILDAPENLDSEELENFIKELISSNQNLLIFLEYLNNHRSKGEINLKKKSLDIISDIFLQILNSNNNGDSKIIQLTIILSQTYYHEEKDQKEYIVHNIKDSQILKEKKFWMDYLKGLLEEEMLKVNKIKNAKLFEKKMASIFYTTILTVTKNMIDFELDMDFILLVNNEAFELYNIPDNQKKDIINYLIEEMKSH